MKKSTLITSVIIIILFSVGVFWTVHALNKEAETPTKAPLQALTATDVTSLSKQTQSTLQALANSGGNSASQKDLATLVKNTKKFKLTDDANSNYVKNLTACLETLQQYKTGKADKKSARQSLSYFCYK